MFGMPVPALAQGMRAGANFVPAVRQELCGAVEEQNSRVGRSCVTVTISIDPRSHRCLLLQFELLVLFTAVDSDISPW